MPNMFQLKGVNKMISKFKRLERKSKREDNVTVLVGYTANYALKVHEDLNAAHTVGQSKYLEQPARELNKELVTIIKSIRIATGSLLKGLLTAGLRLQRASQLLVPIDTGNLKGSAFTKKE